MNRGKQYIVIFILFICLMFTKTCGLKNNDVILNFILKTIYLILNLVRKIKNINKEVKYVFSLFIYIYICNFNLKFTHI